MIKGGSHLEATVALYPIKLLLVAASTLNYTVVEPPAPLHSGVVSHQMIFLPM
jgi:hypothetical protein